MSLTDDDKRWIAEQLLELEHRLSARIEGVEISRPAGSLAEARHRAISESILAIDREREQLLDLMKRFPLPPDSPS